MSRTTLVVVVVLVALVALAGVALAVPYDPGFPD